VRQSCGCRSWLFHFVHTRRLKTRESDTVITYCACTGAVELRNALTGAFAVELPPTIAIDYPTITALAELIYSKAPASAPQQPAPAGVSPELSEPAPAAVSRDSIRAAVSAAVADILGATAAVDSRQPLMEAGLDSLGAVELRNALQSRFGVQLPATVVIDYPSVDALTAFVATLVTPAAGAVSLVAGAQNAHCCAVDDHTGQAAGVPRPGSMGRPPNAKPVLHCSGCR